MLDVARTCNILHYVTPPPPNDPKLLITALILSNLLVWVTFGVTHRYNCFVRRTFHTK